MRLVTIDPRRIELAEYGDAAPRAAPGDQRRRDARPRPRDRARRLLRPRVHRRAHRGLRRAPRAARRPTRPTVVEEISGVPAADLEAAAHIYGEADERVLLVGPRRHRAQVRLRGRAADLQRGADDRQDRPPRLGAAAAAGPEQRSGLLRHGRPAGHVHGVPLGRRRGRRAQLRGGLRGLGPAGEGLQGPGDVRRRGRGRPEGDVHLRRGRRPDRPRHRARREGARGRSSSWSARTSSRPRRRTSPT